ncbi:MAG: arsenate reductase ArsC [Dehalococcoidales bacterium]|nr:arsenate reductase ArsC [Dehalococcoidales bacterium]
MKKKTFLFVCVHNSGRSQIAEAFFNQLAKGKFTAYSAGTKPASEINPLIVQVMCESGLDISKDKPKMLTPEMVDKADRVITMGCNVAETCPASFIPAEDWQIEDPEGKTIDEVRKIKGIIWMRVKRLVTELFSEQLNTKQGET